MIIGFALKLDAILIIIVSAVATALVGGIIPKGNVTIGIIVFGVGMMLFTMIMGNAFAAITVMAVGIGAPFVLAYGADPAAIGILALTCGYCGTLCTPMAANFNIVPVAMLDMKDRMGEIKKQVLPAMVMIVVQIGQIVWQLNMAELFDETYQNMMDWCHVNSAAYYEKDRTILISLRNVHADRVHAHRPVTPYFIHIFQAKEPL